MVYVKNLHLKIADTKSKLQKTSLIFSDLNVRSFFVRGNSCSVFKHYKSDIKI